MPRLFTGIEIPAEVARALGPFRGGLPGARWIEAADYHVTLRFLGDVEPEMAEEMHAELLAARPRPDLAVTLDGLASFGGHKPRALLASVVPTSELVDLHGEHERMARRAGAEPNTRRFTPHVTLARLRREATPEALAAYLSQAPVFPPIAFTATRVALFSARESRGGGPYPVEAAYPFAP